MKDRMRNEKQFMKIPVYAGLLFSLLQIMMALYSNSQAVLMDSIYDFAEVIVLILIIFLIPLFYKPTSERKPFGYLQVESLLILGKGMLLIAVTVGLILANIQMIMHNGNQIDQTLIGYFELGLACLSTLILLLLCYMKKKTTSPLIDAEIVGWKIDVFSSIGVAMAFFLSSMLQETSMSWISPYVDQIIAIIIALIMLPQPYRMIKESLKNIVLFAPEDKIVQEIKTCAEEVFDDYAYEISYYDVIQTGRKIWIEIYIHSDTNMMNITQLQRLKEKIELALKDSFDYIDVQITPDLIVS